MRDSLFIVAIAILSPCAVARAEQHVTRGPDLDYQPSIVRSSDDGARIVVFERPDPSTLS
ncbi:MAG TPA: hypothetical protein VGO25_13530 [Rhodanobacteraceae bacterium]|jgi:hypothetical protein|nr:hypothetical protein [Rhodanobacteraceae bacterium]